MAKDPAFLFYYQDWLVGTAFMTKTEKGIYIDLLCHLADKGHMTKEDILSICNAHAFTEILESKFKVDVDGSFFNQRLRDEMEKRVNYTESRRNNAKSKHKQSICKAHAEHMENENENVIKDEIENKDGIKVKKRRHLENAFERLWKDYRNKVGKSSALVRFLSTVKTKDDLQNIVTALAHYNKHLEVNSWKSAQDGKTWFGHWKDWVVPIKEENHGENVRTGKQEPSGEEAKDPDKYAGSAKTVRV
jgi:hypothetical protein